LIPCKNCGLHGVACCGYVYFVERARLRFRGDCWTRGRRGANRESVYSNATYPVTFQSGKYVCHSRSHVAGNARWNFAASHPADLSRFDLASFTLSTRPWNGSTEPNMVLSCTQRYSYKVCERSERGRMSGTCKYVCECIVPHLDNVTTPYILKLLLEVCQHI
jgi:hypothetical protein